MLPLFLVLSVRTFNTVTKIPLFNSDQLCDNAMPVLNVPIVCDNAMPVLNEDMLNHLSSDKKYLYDIVHAIRSGNASQDLSVRNPGPLNHARWVTFANRVYGCTYRQIVYRKIYTPLHISS